MIKLYPLIITHLQCWLGVNDKGQPGLRQAQADRVSHIEPTTNASPTVAWRTVTVTDFPLYARLPVTGDPSELARFFSNFTEGCTDYGYQSTRVLTNGLIERKDSVPVPGIQACLMGLPKNFLCIARMTAGCALPLYTAVRVRQDNHPTSH